MLHQNLPTFSEYQKIFAFWWRLSPFFASESHFMAVLSPDEQRRANRFMSPLIKTRFIISRGILRHILAFYTQQSPEKLTFAYGTRGKPTLANIPFAFNLSHSEDVALLAIAQTAHIGADVEYMAEMAEMRRVASDYFSADEQIALFTLPPREQMPAFYRCWTRKEAYIKARGDGFALPLDKFDVTLAPDDPPCLLRTLDDDSPQNWQFFHLEPTKGYMGAVCLPTGDWEMEMIQITPPV
jgi:4'-phosphopantetheinyl transferase